MFLRSEKKMKQELQGTWQREFLGDIKILKCGIDSTFYRELWTFDGDRLVTTYSHEVFVGCDFGAKDSTNVDLLDTLVLSKFKVDANLSRAFLKLQLIDRGNDTTVFVDKWEFVELEKGVLYLATDDPKSNSVLQREFFKVK